MKRSLFFGSILIIIFILCASSSFGSVAKKYTIDEIVPVDTQTYVEIDFVELQKNVDLNEFILTIFDDFKMTEYETNQSWEIYFGKDFKKITSITVFSADTYFDSIENFGMIIKYNGNSIEGIMEALVSKYNVNEELWYKDFYYIHADNAYIHFTGDLMIVASKEEVLVESFDMMLSGLSFQENSVMSKYKKLIPSSAFYLSTNMEGSFGNDSSNPVLSMFAGTKYIAIGMDLTDALGINFLMDVEDQESAETLYFIFRMMFKTSLLVNELPPEYSFLGDIFALIDIDAADGILSFSLLIDEKTQEELMDVINLLNLMDVFDDFEKSEEMEERVL